jgi:hypothetical protein
MRRGRPRSFARSLSYCEDNGFARLLTASDFYIDMSADQILSASFEGTPLVG